MKGRITSRRVWIGVNTAGFNHRFGDREVGFWDLNDAWMRHSAQHIRREHRAIGAQSRPCRQRLHLAGGALFIALFVSRAAQAAGPGAGPFMGALLTRTRLADVMLWASLLTVGSGAWMWGRNFGGGMPGGWRGAALAVGALAWPGALGLGVVRQRPTILSQDLVIEMAGNPPIRGAGGPHVVS
jgi:hypothetical protein